MHIKKYHTNETLLLETANNCIFIEMSQNPICATPFVLKCNLMISKLLGNKFALFLARYCAHNEPKLII